MLAASLSLKLFVNVNHSYSVMDAQVSQYVKLVWIFPSDKSTSCQNCTPVHHHSFESRESPPTLKVLWKIMNLNFKISTHRMDVLCMQVTNKDSIHAHSLPGTKLCLSHCANSTIIQWLLLYLVQLNTHLGLMCTDCTKRL